MYEFNYKRPASLADAVSALQAAEDGQFLAGGHTLLPTLKQRLARPSDLIDISQIGELLSLIHLSAPTRPERISDDVIGLKK